MAEVLLFPNGGSAGPQDNPIQEQATPRQETGLGSGVREPNIGWIVVEMVGEMQERLRRLERTVKQFRETEAAGARGHNVERGQSGGLEGATGMANWEERYLGRLEQAVDSIAQDVKEMRQEMRQEIQHLNNTVHDLEKAIRDIPNTVSDRLQRQFRWQNAQVWTLFTLLVAVIVGFGALFFSVLQLLDTLTAR